MKLREKLERLMKANWRIPKEFGAVHDFGGARNAKTAEWVYEIAKLETNYARLLRVARAVKEYKRVHELIGGVTVGTIFEMKAATRELEEALAEVEHLL